MREGPRRAGDLPVLVADASNARKALGWSPKITGMVGIVDSAWRWHAQGIAAVDVLVGEAPKL